MGKSSEVAVMLVPATGPWWTRGPSRPQFVPLRGDTGGRNGDVKNNVVKGIKTLSRPGRVRSNEEEEAQRGRRAFYSRTGARGSIAIKS